MSVENINFSGTDISLIQKENGRKIEEVKLEPGMSVDAVKNIEDSRATDKRKQLLDIFINENPDLKISDEIELHIIKSLLLNEERIKMPTVEQIGETGFTWYPEEPGYKVVNNYFGSENSNMTIINIKKENGEERVTSTAIFDNDNDGYADSCQMLYDYGDSFRKEVWIDLNRGSYSSEIKEN